MPSPAGEAVQMLPTSVPRFCTWAPPMSRAAFCQPAKAGGRPMRRISSHVVNAPKRKRPSSSLIPLSSAMAPMSRMSSRRMSPHPTRLARVG